METNYSGTLRISNSKTLQRWIDNGSYQKQLDNGYLFNVGCGRFRREKCICTKCRRETSNNELQKIINSITLNV